MTQIKDISLTGSELSEDELVRVVGGQEPIIVGTLDFNLGVCRMDTVYG
ncbi:hypothetical protein IMZ11_17675 [Microtetraspora sp. AC03309]|nr:hypothetical protein [Microtetraspora sp. AC03309]MCC5577456.1 hypothetical protein [Microtetraspora sp. AC03309]